MNKIWICINIDKTALVPVLIFDGQNALPAKNMTTQECYVNTVSQKNINIEMLYKEGEDISCLTTIYSEKCTLLKERGLISAISSIFDGNKSRTINVSIFFNENKDGLCIGFLASKYHPLRYIVNNKFRGSLPSEIVSTCYETDNKDSAKSIFIDNIDRFAQVLLLTTSNKIGRSANIIEEWIKVISSIKNSDSLLSEFNKYKSDINSWLKLLYSWGLKQDSCKQYNGGVINNEYYITDNLTAIDINKDYVVLIPCWTIWTNYNGKSVEKLVTKGIITEK